MLSKRGLNSCSLIQNVVSEGRLALPNQLVKFLKLFDLSISALSFLKSYFWCFVSVCLSLLFLYALMAFGGLPCVIRGGMVCLLRGSLSPDWDPGLRKRVKRTEQRLNAPSSLASWLWISCDQLLQAPATPTSHSCWTVSSNCELE